MVAVVMVVVRRVRVVLMCRICKVLMVWRDIG